MAASPTASILSLPPLAIWTGDYVHQPFEPELDWTRFSVTLPQSEIPRLHGTLGAITVERYQKMQAGNALGQPHTTMLSSTDAQPAVAYTMRKPP